MPLEKPPLTKPLSKKILNKNLLLRHNLASVGPVNTTDAFIFNKNSKLRSMYSNTNKLGISRIGWISLYKFKGDSSYSESAADGGLGTTFELFVESASKREDNISEFPFCFDYKNPVDPIETTINDTIYIYLSSLDKANKKLYIAVRPWIGSSIYPPIKESMLSSLSYMIYSDTTIKDPDMVYKSMTMELTKLMMKHWFNILLPEYPESFFWDIKNSLEFTIRSL